MIERELIEDFLGIFAILEGGINEQEYLPRLGLAVPILLSRAVMLQFP